jgi:hypothetical protein
VSIAQNTYLSIDPHYVAGAIAYSYLNDKIAATEVDYKLTRTRLWVKNGDAVRLTVYDWAVPFDFNATEGQRENYRTVYDKTDNAGKDEYARVQYVAAGRNKTVVHNGSIDQAELMGIAHPRTGTITVVIYFDGVYRVAEANLEPPKRVKAIFTQALTAPDEGRTEETE